MEPFEGRETAFKRFFSACLLLCRLSKITKVFLEIRQNGVSSMCGQVIVKVVIVMLYNMVNLL